MKHSRHSITNNAAAASTMTAAHDNNHHADCNDHDDDDDDDWLALESKMTSILSTQTSQAPTELSIARHSSTLLHTTLAIEHSNRLLTDSSNIQSTLTNSINQEKTALQTESQELHTAHSTLQQLQSTKSNLLHSLSSIQSQLVSAQTNISEYESICSTEIDTIQYIESQHVKQLPKIKNELTFYVHFTNIKWDYGSVEKLRGEVSLVNKGVLRNFEIDKEELDDGSGGGEVVIADRLWNIIEG